MSGARIHRRSRTVMAVVAAGAVLAMIAGPVTAAKRDSSRSVVFGSGTHEVLRFTPAKFTPGGFTETTMTLENTGSQTLTKPTLALGTLSAPDPTTPTLLPAGITIHSYSAPAGAVCTTDGPAQAYVGLSCIGANLASKTSISLVVVLGASTSSSGGTVVASAKVSEVTNDQGQNRDTWHARGNAVVGNDCALSESKIPNGVAVGFEVGESQCSAQTTTTSVTASAYTAGRLLHTSSGPNCRPGGGAVCFGQYAELVVGAESGVTWTMSWDVSILPTTFKLSKFGVLHFEGSGTTRITEVCADAADVDCFVTAPAIVGGRLTATFRTLENGFGKGYG